MYPEVPKPDLIQLIEAEDTRTWDAVTMVRLLGDPNPKVRSRTAYAAGRIGDERAIPQLVQRLKGDASTEANAARVLGAASDVGAVGLLETTMATDVDSQARVESIRALASLAQGRSAAPLLKQAGVLLASRPLPTGELLEIVAALGRVLPNSK